MNPTADSAVAARKAQAVQWQKSFFAAPNLYRLDPADCAEAERRIMEMLKPALHHHSQGHEWQALLFPYRDQTAAETTWYACASDDAQARALADDIMAFVGPSYARFEAMHVDGSTTADALVPAAFGQRVLRFAGQRGYDSKIAEQWQRYWNLLQRRPRDCAAIPQTFAQVRARFDRALLTGDEPAARAAISELRGRHGLSAENALFLDIRLLAAFSRWEAIVGHRLLASLLGLRLPPETYGDLVQALYEFHVAPFEATAEPDRLITEFRSELLTFALPLFRTRGSSCRPAVLKSFLLYELTQASPDPLICVGLLDKLPLESFGAVDAGLRARVLALQTAVDPAAVAQAALEAEQFDRAYELWWPQPDSLPALRALLRCAREIEDPTRAAAVRDRVQTAAPSLRAAVQAASPNMWKRVCDYATRCVPVMPTWVERFSWRPDGPESAADYVARWREGTRAWDTAALAAEGGLPQAAADILIDLAVMHPDVYDQVLPLWQELFVERLPASAHWLPVYRALLETLRMRDAFGNEGLMLVRAVLERILIGAGVDRTAYVNVVDEVHAIFEVVDSPHTLDRSIEICDLLAVAPCRDESARLRLLTRTLDLARRCATRLTKTQRTMLAMLAGECGIAFEPASDAAADCASNQEGTGVAGLRLALYSLETAASHRARDVLKQLYPGLRIDLAADEVCTDQLKSLARSVDLFVFAWKRSSHQAYYCVKDTVRSADRLLMAPGAGTCSLVETASKSLQSFAVAGSSTS